MKLGNGEYRMCQGLETRDSGLDLGARWLEATIWNTADPSLPLVAQDDIDLAEGDLFHPPCHPSDENLLMGTPTLRKEREGWVAILDFV
jgi:hypothetical protein